MTLDLAKAMFFLGRAIELSAENVAEGGRPFATIIVRHDQIIATGKNLTHLVYDPTAHGEVVAVREACRALGSLSLRECDVYTISHPCPMCLGALYHADPRMVVFSHSMEDKVRFGLANLYPQFGLPFDRRDLPMHQVFMARGDAVFTSFRERIARR